MPLVDNHVVLIGNDKLMAEARVAYHDCTMVGTILHVALDGEYVGHIVIADVVKPEAKQAISMLHDAGVTKTVMLTGDRTEVAQAVARDLGIDEVHAQLLPQEKVSEVEKLFRRVRAKRKNLLLWVMVLMMLQFLPVQILVLLWAPWDLMRQLKRQMSF